MSTPLTADQAIALLREHPDAYDTPDKLRALAAQVDADAPGRITVLYSGSTAKGVWSSDVINAMRAAGEDVRVINASHAADFLESRDFLQAAAKAHGLDDFRALADAAKDHPAKVWLYHPSKGPWADASARFVDATVGEVRAIVGDANPNRVFGATEVPHALANEKIPTIEGIPRETLQARQSTHGTQAAFEMIAARSREHVALLRVAADTPVNYAGALLREERGQFRLDSRDYFTATGLEGRTPAFPTETRPLIGNMEPPTEYARAGQLHLQELQAQSVPVQSPRSGVALAKALGALGTAATAYDALTTASRASGLNAQGSVLAARSEWNHFAARNIGGWAGAAAGAAVGWETGPGVIAFAAVGAISTSAAGEKVADWWDQRQIYRQTDGDGVSWQFNGRQWVRQDQADLSNDGVDAPQRQAFAALPEKANELNYRATLAAVDLAARDAPPPRNPYRLPVAAADVSQRSPFESDRAWVRDPRTGGWQQEITEHLDGRVPVTRHEPASPERAAQLDRQSAEVIAANIANGPAARTARVEQAYRHNGWERYGPLPAGLQRALSDPDTLTASNGKQYQRDADGNWTHEGRPAEGNLKLELDTTRATLQTALAQHADAMQAVRGPAARSPEERDRADLAATYAGYGIAPDAQTMDAVLLAVQRTRQAHGIDASTTSLAPQPGAQGTYDVNSPLAHLYKDANGVVRVAAVTSAEEIRRALDDVQVRGRSGAATAHRIGQPLQSDGVSDDAARQTVAAVRTGHDLSTDGQADHTIPLGLQQAQQQAAETREKQERAQAAPARTPADPDHPDHALLEKLRGQVRGLDQQAGKGWDEHSERLAASALVMAKRMGFTDKDELHLGFNQATDRHAGGEILHLARTGPHASVDPAANRSHMPTAEALSKPAEERHQQAQDIAAQQQELERQQMLARGADDLSRGGPTR